MRVINKYYKRLVINLFVFYLRILLGTFISTLKKVKKNNAQNQILLKKKRRKIKEFMFIIILKKLFLVIKFKK